MADRLAELRELEESERKHAMRRLEVSREVRRAVWQAETAELLRLRDAGETTTATTKACSSRSTGSTRI
jgi:hypothetical protein